MHLTLSNLVNMYWFGAHLVVWALSLSRHLRGDQFYITAFPKALSLLTRLR